MRAGRSSNALEILAVRLDLSYHDFRMENIVINVRDQEETKQNTPTINDRIKRRRKKKTATKASEVTTSVKVWKSECLEKVDPRRRTWSVFKRTERQQAAKRVSGAQPAKAWAWWWTGAAGGGWFPEKITTPDSQWYYGGAKVGPVQICRSCSRYVPHCQARCGDAEDGTRLIYGRLTWYVPAKSATPGLACRSGMRLREPRRREAFEG
ncbi:hypothetical protein V8F20_003801 [Naviculisporaceae sp. PSN 640]